MYDPEISERRAWAACKRLGVRLVRSTRDECQQRALDLTDSFDLRTYTPKRVLSQEERDWMLKEQILCRHDYRYYCENYVWIVSRESGIIPFIFWKAQEILLSLCAEHERKGIAIARIQNKARQLGVSTFEEIMMAYRVQFGYYVRGLIASSSEDDTKQMAMMIEVCWERMPFFLMPQFVGPQHRGQRITFGDQGCTLSMQWLNQKKDVGRGWTPHVCHITEAAYCDHPEEKLESGLLNAMHDSPYMYLTFESTSSGKGNWWHTTWESAKKTWGKGGRLRPNFLPWYVGRDIYPNEGWLRTNPIPDVWEPKDITKRHAARANEFVEKNELLCKALGMSWKMPKEQMWHWEARREEAIRKRTLNKFYQEMPANDLESFQLGNSPIVSADILATYRENVREPIAVYGLRGRNNEIPAHHQPQAWEIDKKAVEKGLLRTMKMPDGRKFDLVPLLHEGSHDATPHGRIYIWEQPKPEFRYGMGGDCGFGVQQDRSVLEMCRRATPYRAPGFVAEFASDTMMATDLIPFAWVLHQMYTVKQGPQLFQPLMALELAASGAVLNKALLALGCKNQHYWKRVDRYRNMPATNPALGIQMTSWFRDAALGTMLKTIRDFCLEIDSPWFLDELGTLTVGDNYGKIEAEKGNFDDRVMAGAMTFFTLHNQQEVTIPAFGLTRFTPDIPDEDKYATFPGYDNSMAVNPLSPLRSYLASTGNAMPNTAGVERPNYFQGEL